MTSEPSRSVQLALDVVAERITEGSPLVDGPRAVSLSGRRPLGGVQQWGQHLATHLGD